MDSDIQFPAVTAVNGLIVFQLELTGFHKGEMEGAIVPLPASGTLAVPVVMVESFVLHNLLV